MVDWSPRANVKTVIFLCTGNYYRSRFAEEFFNHHAERAGLHWIARWRGLALERGMHNIGPISPFALHALKEMAISARCRSVRLLAPWGADYYAVPFKAKSKMSKLRSRRSLAIAR
jgi:hypothetical protein